MRSAAIPKKGVHCLFFVLGGMIIDRRVELLDQLSIFEFEIVDFRLEFLVIIRKSVAYIFPLVSFSLSAHNVIMFTCNLRSQAVDVSLLVIDLLL